MAVIHTSSGSRTRPLITAEHARDDRAAADSEPAKRALPRGVHPVSNYTRPPCLQPAQLSSRRRFTTAGSYDEASEWIRLARESAGGDDLDAALTRKPIEAKLLARQGSLEKAERALEHWNSSANGRAESPWRGAPCACRGSGAAGRKTKRSPIMRWVAMRRKGNMAAAGEGRRLRSATCGSFRTESPRRGSPLSGRSFTGSRYCPWCRKPERRPRPSRGRCSSTGRPRSKRSPAPRRSASSSSTSESPPFA